MTANHFWLDAVGGLVILAAGYYAGRALARVVGEPSGSSSRTAAAVATRVAHGDSRPATTAGVAVGWLASAAPVVGAG